MATENNPPYSLDKTTADRRTERPHWVLDDAVYSISALLLSVIIIHSIWTLIIRPRAEAVLSQRVEVTQKGSGVKAQVLQLRSVYVILKDHEQELCVTLCMWALLLLGMRRMSGGMYHPPVGDEPLAPSRRLLFWLVAVVFLLLFTPVPMRETL